MPRTGGSPPAALARVPPAVHWPGSGRCAGPGGGWGVEVPERQVGGLVADGLAGHESLDLADLDLRVSGVEARSVGVEDVDRAEPGELDACPRRPPRGRRPGGGRAWPCRSPPPGPRRPALRRRRPRRRSRRWARPAKENGCAPPCGLAARTITFLLPPGTSSYSTSTGAGGSKRSNIAATSRRVLSETCCPTTLPSSVMPTRTVPPFPFKKPHRVCPARPSYPVDRFSSRVSDSPAATCRSSSCLSAVVQGEPMATCAAVPAKPIGRQALSQS